MVQPQFHRTTPAKVPLIGNVKATRQDWLNAALSVLKKGGVEMVKIADISADLGVSRSSFYWYFRSRTDLLDALLEYWEHTNTTALVRQTQKPAATITEACCNIFCCNINPNLFDNGLDFAIRDWARRSEHVNAVLKTGDQTRLLAMTQLFCRFGYPTCEATARARVLYYMQIGYDEANLGESLDERLAMVPGYLVAFTGQTPRATEVEAFCKYARTQASAAARS